MPAADLVEVEGPWSYCTLPAPLSLARENAAALQSWALRGRSAAAYDLLIVPGYTPPGTQEPRAPAHAVAIARLDAARALYREGKSRLILVSGGDMHPETGPNIEALAMKAYLLEQGIPSSAIVVEPCARHSTTNLRNAGRFMLKYHLRSALIVTSVDQAFYLGSERISTFQSRSQEDLGYMVGVLKAKSSTTVEFAPSPYVLRRGSDPLDP